MKMNKLQSFKNLQKLGKKAPDLSADLDFNLRASRFQASHGPWTFYYSTERVTDPIMENLCLLAREADVFRKMQNLVDLKVMNYIYGCPSENRRVGHTAIRCEGCKEHSHDALKAYSDYSLEMTKLEQFCQKADKFESIIVIGIGGSYLGTKAVYNCLKPFRKGNKKLYFASNVDPDKLTSIVLKVKLSSTLVLVISKSGSTLEVHAQEKFLRNLYQEHHLKSSDHFACVTEKNSPLDSKSDFMEVFYLQDYIGGRFSVSSMVGAVPIALTCGLDIFRDFLQGMHNMDHHALEEKNPLQNLPLLGALLGIWNRNFLNCDTFAVIPYSTAMNKWTLHLQQLFMESNGKQVCKEDGSLITEYDTCPVVWGTVGTEGQHSYYQCIHQGTRVIPVEFVGFKESQLHQDQMIDGTTNQQKLLANMFAQSIALARGQKTSNNNNRLFPGNRPSHILLADELSPYTLGALLAYYEHYVAFQGFIWDVNSFDQEGVQLGKLLANNLIDGYRHINEGRSYVAPKENSLNQFYLELTLPRPRERRRETRKSA
ncbi:MAG: hypothetical protein A3F09_01600 [Chlamydiae bacterium RIFCSPHIGHO2_12_FULL_49_11]|nr:MAG: hypothetical protein A3F09_01600 [Chlamydiae bacterium RIFCSPHIGHO2_12_FULL_49_11]